MRKSVTLLLAAASMSAVSCSRGHAAQDAGPTISRNYPVGNFRQIDVAGPYDVTVRTGANASVAAQGPQNYLDRIVVEVKGDKLVIRPKGQRGWVNEGWTKRVKANFTITVPQLRAAAIAGSGDLKVDRVAGPSFAGSVAGSGGMNLGAVDVQQLKVDITGSGGIKAGQGKARSASYDIVGSGNVDAGAVQSDQIKVSIAGSGSVRAYATGTADVDIMGSGGLDLSGGAKCKVSKMGSGDARCS